MLDLIEKIGPFAGLAAFIALAVLVFVIFQQSREIRRLREWAGRAPERAADAAEASLAAAEARGEVTPAAEEERPGRIAAARAAIRERITQTALPRLRGVDRRLPVDGRIALGIIAALAVAAGVLTGGLGLVGDDGGNGASDKREAKPEVAVLNGTQVGTVQGVQGLAERVTRDVVRPAGYRVSVQTNAPTGFGQSVVMYTPKAQGAAAQFARAIEAKLGSTRIQPMAADVRQQAKGSPVVLVIGADDSDF